MASADWPAASGTAPDRDSSLPAGHNHAVQFYESPEYLSAVVSDFIIDGLAKGDATVVIATARHCSEFSRALREKGVDVDELRAARRLTLLSANETLSRFMLGTTPEPHAFDAVISKVIARARRASTSGAVRAYGEMVDVLWRVGNREGAITLERLWNDLEHRGAFSLLCAYSLKRFSNANDFDQFRRICDQHTRVLPSENFIGRDEPGRMLEVALLQQRAKALESELAARAALAEELRQTAERERETRSAAERERLEAVRARADADAARRLAEEANRAKSEFLAVMSHELRTPLNAIGGYTELIELGIHGPVTPEQREALDRVQRSKRLLLGLINQVLNYARIETGAVRYEVTSVPLDEVLATCGSIIAPQLRTQGLTYRYSGCDELLTVRADQEKLQQVIINLLANAVKFTERGGTISVDVEPSESTVTIRVRDTGIGIARDRLDVIFDPFVQIDAQYTRTRDGVGLGLAISRELTSGMGGELTVSSEVGAGSEFSVKLRR
jgi:signal transduction histidine kinase